MIRENLFDESLTKMLISDPELRVELGFDVVPPFDRQVIVAENPRLEARVTDKGFTVKSRDANFEYTHSGAERWSHLKGLNKYEIHPRHRFEINSYEDVQRRYGLDKDSTYFTILPASLLTSSPNSRLVIAGMPDVIMDTHYSPNASNHLTVLQARESGEVWQTGKDELFLYLRQFGGQPRNDGRFSRMSQQAASKALGELHIDQIYQQFQHMRAEAIRANRMSPGERTLATYLAK